MKYILFVILMTNDGSFELSQIRTYTAMDACFEGRSVVVEMLGRPIVNYQAMCIRTQK